MYIFTYLKNLYIYFTSILQYFLSPAKIPIYVSHIKNPHFFQFKKFHHIFLISKILTHFLLLTKNTICHKLQFSRFQPSLLTHSFPHPSTHSKTAFTSDHSYLFNFFNRFAPFKYHKHSSFASNFFSPIPAHLSKLRSYARSISWHRRKSHQLGE